MGQILFVPNGPQNLLLYYYKFLIDVNGLNRKFLDYLLSIYTY